MYLVLSAFTSSPISLVAATKASAFSFSVCSYIAINMSVVSNAVTVYVCVY